MAAAAQRYSSSMSSSSNNVVGVHYKVGKKLGEGSFGIIYQGETNKHLATTWHVFSLVFFISF
jgi:hypothetical protein